MASVLYNSKLYKIESTINGVHKLVSLEYPKEVVYLVCDYELKSANVETKVCLVTQHLHTTVFRACNQDVDLKSQTQRCLKSLFQNKNPQIPLHRYSGDEYIGIVYNTTL